MKNILFITTRNIYNHTGEYSLIHRRAEALYKYYNIKTNIISFQSKKRVINYNRKLLDSKCYGKIISIGYSIDSIFFNLYNFKNEIKKYLYNNKPNIIIISGAIIYYNLLNNYKKNDNAMIFYDMHGCVEEIIEYKHPKLKYIVINYFYYYIVKKIEKKTLSICNGIFIVSNYMKYYLKENYKLGKEIKYFNIPCGINSENKNCEEILKLRIRWRKIFSIKENELVFVYSGGVSKWQMIDKIIDFFENKINKINGSKIFIFSKDKNYILKIIKDKAYNLSNYIIKSLDYNELIGALSACDFGLLIRENTITNNVAFPNKFSEYIAAGLNIIISSSLIDQTAITKKYKLGLIYDSINDIDINEIELFKRYRLKNLQNYYKKCIYILDNELNYRKNLKNFVNYICK